ncbi:MAG: elongation factor P [Candidatus Magasanikbacteria bacterium CG10_big_fil_rev_8_21_14_0_10_43_6]|uniref:Elongation factor P n=1 Tax=Candidatus Magasanikbacteria bacterium CG10_big_fil_rev_8_21_14_0_10_43_6 TaxID=1974650 RepID=A0A2M6W0Z3_9BACT|nr:MAG: elongation factor P [Candidatus Magasanikbacteria bacterium CG10_big_fil_rev_8_21_14_0_10_43_6]
MAETTEIKKGAVIQHNGDLYVVVDFKFVNPGKGAAFTKTKMKSITSGKNIEITYKSGESVDVVRVDRQNIQYLYKNGDTYSFMNNESYETLEVPEDIVGDDGKFLKEGLEVIGSFHEGSLVAVQLPKKVEYMVITAPPAVKGDTASGNVTKEVVLENGLHIHAPIFIKEGETIVINTETEEYGGRVSE